MVSRRVAGLPLEHVLGWAEFCGLRVAVSPGVFIPRRRTEFLVHQAVPLVRRAADRTRLGRAAGGPTDSAAGQPAAVVLDLCCGSGAVGAALLAAAGPLELHAADVDPTAVRCARRNVGPTGAQVYQGDLFAPLPVALLGRVDVLVANVPYVPTRSLAQLPVEARTHEPRVALDGGADGLDIVRRVTCDAARWLAPGGHLLVETSGQQAASAVEAAAGGGLDARVACGELDATVVIGTLPAVQNGHTSARWRDAADQPAGRRGGLSRRQARRGRACPGSGPETGR
jgi:release factor glutamine methyltransferase